MLAPCTGAHSTCMDVRMQVLEHVPDVRSLDVHTLLAAVVGAIQHLSQLHDELATAVKQRATM